MSDASKLYDAFLSFRNTLYDCLYKKIMGKDPIRGSRKSSNIDVCKLIAIFFDPPKGIVFWTVSKQILGIILFYRNNLMHMQEFSPYEKFRLLDLMGFFLDTIKRTDKKDICINNLKQEFLMKLYSEEDIDESDSQVNIEKVFLYFHEKYLNSVHDTNAENAKDCEDCEDCQEYQDDEEDKDVEDYEDSENDEIPDEEEEFDKILDEYEKFERYTRHERDIKGLIAFYMEKHQEDPLKLHEIYRLVDLMVFHLDTMKIKDDLITSVRKIFLKKLYDKTLKRSHHMARTRG